MTQPIMDEAVLGAAKTFIAKLKSEPQLLHHPDLAFVREYLESLGAKIPAPAQESTIRHAASLKEWEALTAEAGSKPIVVDFFAEWCGPCKVIAPLFKKLADTYSDKVMFVKVDVDVATDIARKFGISSMPTFRVIKNGEEIDSLVGADPGKLSAMVGKAASGDYTPADADEEEEEVEVVEDDEPEVTQEEEEEEEEEDEGEDAVLKELEQDPEVLKEEDRDVNPPPVPMGPMGVELSDADMEKQIEMKGKASELAASGDLEGALAAWNEVIALSASPLTLAKRADVFLKLKKPYAAIRDCDAALEANPDSAKSLKIRGMAYHLLGDWEKAAISLQKGNRLDYDENAGEVQRIVEARWNKIREYRLQKEAKARDRDVKRKTQARAKAREEAIRRYEEQKKAEEEAANGSGSGMPGGMPGGKGGAVDFEKLLNSLDVSDDVKEKVKDPAVKAKLMKVFGELQGNPSAAMTTAMQYMSDPDIGPILSAIMEAMAGGMGGAGGAGGAGGMPGMAGGMPGAGGGSPNMRGMPRGMGGMPNAFNYEGFQ